MELGWRTEGIKVETPDTGLAKTTIYYLVGFGLLTCPPDWSRY